ncbi:hypothetical protein OAN21_00025 [Alphaproteobacteria bacterium]|nr:hypothetical protein [Alphaproteobacteria bacterium]
MGRIVLPTRTILTLTFQPFEDDSFKYKQQPELNPFSSPTINCAQIVEESTDGDGSFLAEPPFFGVKGCKGENGAFLIKLEGGDPIDLTEFLGPLSCFASLPKGKILSLLWKGISVNVNPSPDSDYDNRDGVFFSSVLSDRKWQLKIECASCIAVSKQ